LSDTFAAVYRALRRHLDRSADGQVMIQPRRGRRVGVALTCVLAIAFVVGITAYQVLSNSRYVVIGKSDPASGYRIEYTISSRYRMSREPMIPNTPEFGYSDVFSIAPPNKAIQWVNEYILRRPKPVSFAGPPSWQPGSIVQQNVDGIMSDGYGPDAQGYPDLSSVRMFANNVVVKHMLVSGCKATLCAYSPKVAIKHLPRVYYLMIRPKDRAMGCMYSFLALDYDSEPHGAVNELMKIMDSIRITNAK
jgi:hypothetical protein